MTDKWSRDDLPSLPDVLGEVTTAERGEGAAAYRKAALAHLNTHYPKPGRDHSLESQLAQVIRERDAAVARAEAAERERDASAERSVRQAETISNLREWLAEAELARDAALDCADLLERERDERMVRAENAEWGMGQPSTAWSNADLEAEVRRRTQCLRDNLNGVTRSRDEWKARAEKAEARTAPAVSYEHLHQEVVAAYEYGRNPTERVEFIVKYMCALFGVEAEAAVDPVEAEAYARGWRECATAIQDGLGAWDALQHYQTGTDR